MSEETKKTKERPIIDMIFRLVNIYLAATFFFYGWEKWRNEEYLLAVSWFTFTLSQIAQVFGWFSNKSKFTSIIMLIPVLLALIVILANQWL